MTNPKRHRITERFLSERLGLEEGWFLPDEFPSFLRETLRLPEIRKLENHLQVLVEDGCQERVLWFCLAQVSKEAHAWRSGREYESVPVPGSLGDEDFTLRVRDRKIGTREDLKTVANSCKKVRKAVREYLAAFDLIASAFPEEHPLPAGMLTEIDGPIEAFSLLRGLLFWTENLAADWQAIEEAKVLKGKGPLYLGIYVKHATQKPHEDVLMDILSFISDSGEVPSITKTVKNFHSRYPRLYRRLRDRLIEHHYSA